MLYGYKITTYVLLFFWWKDMPQNIKAMFGVRC